MEHFSTLEETREYFKNDRFATSNGMVIDEIFEHGCVCSMVIGENHLNAHGMVMGGALFTLADFAFAVAANNEHSPTTGINSSISYLNASKGTKLFARAELVKSGRTTTVFEVTVTDDLGKRVALFLGTGLKL